MPGDAKSLTLIDWNSDSKPDLLASRNNETMLAFTNEGHRESTPLKLNLNGSKRNPQAIGAK
jgi:hypothetical protein